MGRGKVFGPVHRQALARIAANAPIRLTCWVISVIIVTRSDLVSLHPQVKASAVLCGSSQGSP